MPRVMQPQSALQAFRWTEQWPAPVQVEQVGLDVAGGRILAGDIFARCDFPATDVCPHEGFALQAAASVGASEYSPLVLRLVSAPVRRDSAIRVQAGAPLPPGADAVMALHEVDINVTHIELCSSLAVGDGVAAAGEEFTAGELLCRGGRRLRPHDLARLAQAQVPQVAVLRRPRVGLLFADAAARQLNAAMLVSLIRRDGALPVQLSEASATELSGWGLAALADTDALDVLLLVGGSGYDESEVAYAALQADPSVRIDIDGVAINPGTGAVLGRCGDLPLLLLPGMPLACFAAYELLLARLLRRFSGIGGELAYVSRRLPLASKIASRIGRMEMARVRLQQAQAHPLAVAEARILATLGKADGFVLIDENSEGYAAGEVVNVYLFDPHHYDNEAPHA